MKKLLLILALLSLPLTSYAITFVNANSFLRAGSNANATTSISVTANNLLVVNCAHTTNTLVPTNVTDTIGNAFTQFATSSTPTVPVLMTAYYAVSSGTASDIISCNFNGTPASDDITVGQWSGTANIGTVLDATSTNATTTLLANWSAGPFTTASSSEVIVGLAGNTGGTRGLVAGAGYTMEASSTTGGTTSYGVEDLVTSTIQTNVSSTVTDDAGTATWTFIVGTFRATSTPAAILPASNLTIYDSVIFQ